MAEVIGVVIGNQQGLAENRMAWLAMRELRHEVHVRAAREWIVAEGPDLDPQVKAIVDQHIAMHEELAAHEIVRPEILLAKAKQNEIAKAQMQAEAAVPGPGGPEGLPSEGLPGIVAGLLGGAQGAPQQPAGPPAGPAG